MLRTMMIRMLTIAFEVHWTATAWDGPIVPIRGRRFRWLKESCAEPEPAEEDEEEEETANTFGNALLCSALLPLLHRVLTWKSPSG